MQVRNQIAIGLNQPNSINKQKKYLRNQLAFGQEPTKTAQPKDEEKKKGFTLKKFTNIAGTVALPAAILACVFISARRSHNDKALDLIEAGKKKLAGYVEDKEIKTQIAEHKKNNNGKCGNLFYKMGIVLNNWKSIGEELLNNGVYGFGTVIVMPLVILFSPIGKKKSSKEDKIFTVLRQPLSFAMLFPAQLTIDKFFKKIVPKFISKNSMEDANLYEDAQRTTLKTKDENGIDIRDKVLSSIKFDKKAHKSALSEALKEALGEESYKIVSELKLEDQLTKLKDVTKANDVIKKVLGGSEHSNILSVLQEVGNKNVQRIFDRLDGCIHASSRARLLEQSLVIGGNVLFSAPVGCTALNVAYGSFMKNVGSKLVQMASVPKNAEKGGN